jgi:hypothetical protein
MKNNQTKRVSLYLPTKIYGLVLSLSENQHSFSATILMLVCEALTARGLIVDRSEPVYRDEI